MATMVLSHQIELKKVWAFNADATGSDIILHDNFKAKRSKLKWV